MTVRQQAIDAALEELGASEIKCPTCDSWLLPGEACEDCQRERLREPGMWGPAIDRLARNGYSPMIEHFPGLGPRMGYRVGVWPQGPRAPLIEIGITDTFEDAVGLLVNWRPAV